MRKSGGVSQRNSLRNPAALYRLAVNLDRPTRYESRVFRLQIRPAGDDYPEPCAFQKPQHFELLLLESSPAPLRPFRELCDEFLEPVGGCLVTGNLHYWVMSVRGRVPRPYVINCHDVPFCQVVGRRVMRRPVAGVSKF